MPKIKTKSSLILLSSSGSFFTNGACDSILNILRVGALPTVSAL